MINRQFSSELGAQGPYTQAVFDINNAVQQHGTLSAIAEHHDFVIPVPDGLASDRVADLDISITDTIEPGKGIRSIFQVAARGHQTDEFIEGKYPSRTMQFMQADGSSVYVPVFADLLVDLYTPHGGEETKTNVTGFAIQNYHGAKKAGVKQDPENSEIVSNPIYRLLLDTCEAAPTEPVDATVYALRHHALHNGHSVARQNGRLEVRGQRNSLSYTGAQPILYSEEGVVRLPLHELYKTTTFDSENRRRIDTSMVINTLVDVDNAQGRGHRVQTDISGISVRRSIISLDSDVPSEKEKAGTSREAISFIAPMAAVARAALGIRRQPIRLDRRHAA